MNGRIGAKNPAAGHGRQGEFANGSFLAVQFEIPGFGSPAATRHPLLQFRVVNSNSLHEKAAIRRTLALANKLRQLALAQTKSP